MRSNVSELEKLEDIIVKFKYENDAKKKHIFYLNLVDESLKLVKKIVSGMYPMPNGVTNDDLIQVGALGVLKAIEDYKITNKGSFKTYATKFIKGRILQYLRDKTNLVKPPRLVIENITKVREYVENFNQDNIPDVKNIAQQLNLSVSVVEDVLNIDNCQNIISLDQNIYSCEGVETLADRITSKEEENYAQTFENKKIIEFALNKLDKDEKFVIYKYYIEGLTKKDISKLMGISAMQVGRLIKRVLNKMYIILEKELLEDNNE